MGHLARGSALLPERPRFRVRPSLVGASVALLVVVSASVRFAASLTFKGPWIAPDEMVYALSGGSFWHTGDLRVLGTDAPFYGLYPLVAGLPLALFGVADGLVVLKALQAVLVSLTAAIVYVWAKS